MRIIAGMAKGRRLFSPKGSFIRPASDKVKGAIFNILGDIEGTKILDLFAGSGSVGLEAASRGAALVLFVEAHPAACQLIQKNIALCRFDNVCHVVKGKIPSILKNLARTHYPITFFFDTIFVDPPYDKGLIFPALKGLLANNLVDAQSTIIVEHSPREMPDCQGFEVTDQRKYGQTLISFLKCLRV